MTTSSTDRPLTIAEVLERSSGFLKERGSPTPRLDAELLLAHALGCERIDLYTRHDRPLTGGERDAARDAVARRGRREPVAHILGRRDFRGLTLSVTADVLVPRPETELLVERAVAFAARDGSVLDWGTGSGAVALALADERPDLRVVALERSGPALEVARANGADLGLDVEWVHSDGFAAVAGRRFDLVVANPPYLSERELHEAPAELGFEPAEALSPGPAGTEALAALAGAAGGHLNEGGHLLAEIGADQEAIAVELWRRAGFSDVTAHRDLAGLPRVVEGRR